ncbi:MAG TPA: hypothetical protein PLI01_02275 [Nitrospira sp.]|nr:hypothetical protein [Nitrospira sp.]
MNPQHPLTRSAQNQLITKLQRFGNTLNVQHKMALCALNDAMTSMAEGRLQGRVAFGLPTGTGKTLAIVEWITAVHRAGLSHSVAVAASRIEALCTLKKDLMANGVPESLIGLLHEGAKKQYSLEATTDNDARPFLLISHQLIRASETNLTRYNAFQEKPRNLLLYDESLITSDCNHFGTRPLYASLAACIEMVKGIEEHASISNFLTEIKAIISAAEDAYDPIDVTLIEQPQLDPRLAAQYQRFFAAKDGGKVVSEFLKAANLPLRMLKSGNTAIVSYQVVVPEALKNILVLDASFPIRKLCHFDSSITSAETLPNLKKAGVPSFATLKRFDHVDLYRLKTYGGRYSMEKRFKDKAMAKEVAEVVKTIDPSEAVLLFLYKTSKGGVNYERILRTELEKAGVNTDATIEIETVDHEGKTLIEEKPRIQLATWGMETSLNDFKYCSHVFLVGIVHRDDTELQGQYLGQIQDLNGEIGKALTSELQVSERAHSAYQALSRGTCRTVSNGQACPMTGYIVEVDPEIETALSSVMPGVRWKTWEPFYLKESDNLIDTWVGRIRKYLNDLKDNRISSQSLKKAIGADKVAPDTWTAIIRKIFRNVPNKEIPWENTELFTWKMEGRSLVRETVSHFALEPEDVA